MRAGVMTTIALVGVLIGRASRDGLDPGRGRLGARGACVPEPPIVIELSFADGTPIHAIQVVDEDTDRRGRWAPGGFAP